MTGKNERLQIIKEKLEMKRFALILAGIVGIIGFAGIPGVCVERKGSTPTNTVLTTGDRMVFFKVTISSASPWGITSSSGIVISTYSSTRGEVTCRNTGASEIYLCDNTAFCASASSQSYRVDAGTAGVTSYFTTYNTGGLSALATAASASSNAVYCYEER